MDEIDNDRIGKLLTRLARNEKGIARAQTALEQSKRTRRFMEQRARSRRLIEMGGLFVIAGLMDTNHNIILGALVHAKELETDMDKCRAWTRNGKQAALQWRETGRRSTLLDRRSAAPLEILVAAQKRFTQKLIIRGAVVEKAGLGDWPSVAILGVLLVIARNLDDTARIAAWKRRGAEFRTASKPTQIVVAFTGRIPRPVAARLRSMKLKRKPKTKWFVGPGDPAMAHAIARDAGGEVWVLKQDKRCPW